MTHTHVRRRLCLAAIAAAAGLTALIGVVPAEAATVPAAAAEVVTHAANCGGAVGLLSPAGGTVTSANISAMAAALGTSGSDPILKTAEATHSQWLTTVSCATESAQPDPLSGDATAGPATAHTSTAYSPTWSGYVAVDSGPVEAWANWKVPAVHPNGLVTTDSSTWAGIGGDDSAIPGELIQDGTEQDVRCVSASRFTDKCMQYGYSYYLWYEMYPYEAEKKITSISVSPGDAVGAGVYYIASNRQVHFTLCDYTKKKCVSPAPVQVSPKAPGDTIEWIMERPSVNKNPMPLADFGTMRFTGSGLVDKKHGITSPAGDGAGIWEMQVGSTRLATVGGLSGGDAFSVTWKNDI